jgi:hypothetical protein
MNDMYRETHRSAAGPKALSAGNKITHAKLTIVAYGKLAQKPIGLASTAQIRSLI